jgi:hypothetical protein
MKAAKGDSGGVLEVELVQPEACERRTKEGGRVTRRGSENKRGKWRKK